MAGVPPGVGSLGEYVSLGFAEQGGADVAIQVLNFVPYLQVVMFALDLLELAGIIPNPINLLLQQFAGRPREQASLEQAQRLMSARNPAARIAGIALERMVNEWDIVTSESGSGRAILDTWASQFTGNLTAQGVSSPRAREILVNATSRAAQEGLPLEPELKTPLDQSLAINGPPDAQTALTTQYQKLIAKGLTIDNALNGAEQWLWKHYGLAKVLKLQIGKYIPPNPPPQTVIPGQGGQCPAGYTLNPQTEMCELTPGGQGGGGGGGGGGNVGPDPDGDEITSTLCAQMNSCTQQLISALQGANPQTGPVDDTCCQNVVSAINGVVTVLGSIANTVSTLASPGGTPVDLSGIVASLDAMATALGNLANSSGAVAPPIVEALNNIAAKIPAASGTDVSGVVKAINDQTAEFTVTKAVGDALVAGGYIDPAIAQQIVGGESGDWHLAGLSTSLSESIRTFIEGALGFDIRSKAPIPSTGSRVPGWIHDAFSGYLKGADTFVQPLLKPLLDTIIEQVKPAVTPAVGDAGVDLDTAVASAVSVAITAQIAAAVTDYLGWDLGESTARIAEAIAAGIGYEELRDVQIGPYVKHGIAKVADMNAMKTFQQELPGVGQLTQWEARGLIDHARNDELLALNGLHFSLRPIAIQAAYSGFNARQMLRLIETGLFSQGDIADELNFAGMRPASQKRMLLAAPYLATASQRSQLNAALENAYVNGLLADADLASQLDQAQQNVDRDSLILARVQLQKRVAFAHALEQAYSQELAANVISVDQYRGLLQGLGLQDDWINTHVAVGEMKLLDIETRKAAAAAAALERATVAAERKAAMTNFVDGNIDTVALTALLVGTGLTAAQALAWVDQAVLRKAGGLRWIYGKQLSSSDAQALRARVAALSDQRKRLQITDAAFLAALQALGINQPFLNTIRATADALISPKTAAVTIPVDTN